MSISNANGGLAKTHSYSWMEWSQVLEDWKDLHSISPHASFFNSPPWVGTWLEVFGADLQATIYVLKVLGSPRAAWILVRRTQHWHRIFSMRCVFLGTAGEDEADSACVEYNGFVCHPEYYKDAVSALWTTVNQSPWDEFILKGVQPEVACRIIGDRRASEGLVPTFGINLDSVRGHGDYLKHLSHNTRQQLRKSFRFYGERGPLNVETARQPGEAIAMLDELAGLHQETWRKRGQPGVFSSFRFTDFHRRLITSFPNNVQLLRATAGNQTIGLLYSLVSNSTLYTYQSGFAYEEGQNNARPGLVVTALAIEHCLSHTTLGYFDLMAGTGRYKKSLSTVQSQIGWYVVFGGTLRSKLKELLKRAAGRSRLIIGGKVASPQGADPLPAAEKASTESASLTPSGTESGIHLHHAGEDASLSPPHKR